MMKRNSNNTLLKIALVLSLAVILNLLILFISGFFSHAVNANGLSPVTEMEGTVYAVTSGNNLINFNTITPGAIIRSLAITGLGQGEAILGIDFRPRTGQLYAVSSASRIYTINTSTGAATAIGSSAFTPALAGTSFGFDFNPVPDRIRLVSDNDQDLRLNPDTGAVAATDGTLAYAPGDPNAAANPNVVGAGYTNSFNATTTTTLYGIDSNLDILVRQGSLNGSPVSPNSGQLFTVGALGVDTNDQVGFDIAAPGDLALASLTASGANTSSLYSINLTTGAATMIGAIGGTEIVRDIAVVTRVETIFAVNTNNQLLSFNSGTPGNVTARTISGLPGGESIVGIDFRPATGQLFAVTNASRLYTINTTTAQATAVSGIPFTPALNGNSFGFDFNPVPDRIRLVSDNDQDLRLNPNNGALAAIDGTLAYAATDANANANPNVVSAAYTNSVAGATNTTLYVIDSNLDTLVLQGSIGGSPVSPNSGQLFTVGSLGVNTTDQVGFDIAAQTGAAFASMTLQGAATSGLYAINTITGVATSLGDIGGGAPIVDITIAVRVETVYAVTASNSLVSFNSLTPGTLLSAVPITGLGAGENILGIDFRPASGQLFALSSASRIYTINTISGAAVPAGPAFTPALSGTAFGFDFNPVPDRIRVVSDADQDLRLNPNNGALAAVDGTLAFVAGDANTGADPNVVAVAYTNSVAGTPSTTLFGIDSNLDIMVRQGSPGGSPVSPNSGQLFSIGSLGVNTTNDAGFDISDCSGTGYASLTAMGAAQSQFYTINLLNGAATAVGNIGVNEIVRDIAVATTFIPSAQQIGLAAVNAASFVGVTLAPDTITAMFGTFQTQNGQTAVANSLPLPTTLGGVKVGINGADASLYYVSNTQINFRVPGSVADGQAQITVTNANGTTRSGMVSINRAAPGIFTANSSGSGTAAAVITTDGVTYQSISNPDGTERAIDPGTAASQTYLILFLTGLRNTPAANPNDANGIAESVQVTIQGVPATVTYAGRQPDWEGLDQVNVILPPQLAGAGKVNIQVTANGQVSNSVTMTIGGTAPAITFQNIAIGQTIGGALSPDDQVLIGPNFRTYFFDAYSFSASSGTSLAIDLRSSSFDPTVIIYRRAADGRLTAVAADDDLGGLGDGDIVNNNALLFTTIEQNGDYVLFVTSSDDNPNGTGGYSLRVIGNAMQNISYGAMVNGQIAIGDLQTAAGDYLDAYWFAGSGGDRVQIKMSSASFDSLLILNRNSGIPVDADDNSGGGQDALISVTLPQTGIYVIIATPFAPDRVGNYTLTLMRTNGLTDDDSPLAVKAEPGRESMLKSEAKGANDENRFERYAARRVIER
ncbi:MAG: DUF4394 domain-containing protein [Blastocatellales bacterium]